MGLKADILGLLTSINYMASSVKGYIKKIQNEKEWNLMYFQLFF